MNNTFYDEHATYLAHRSHKYVAAMMDAFVAYKLNKEASE